MVGTSSTRIVATMNGDIARNASHPTVHLNESVVRAILSAAFRVDDGKILIMNVDEGMPHPLHIEAWSVGCRAAVAIDHRVLPERVVGLYTYQLFVDSLPHHRRIIFHAGEAHVLVVVGLGDPTKETIHFSYIFEDEHFVRVRASDDEATSSTPFLARDEVIVVPTLPVSSVEGEEEQVYIELALQKIVDECGIMVLNDDDLLEELIDSEMCDHDVVHRLQEQDWELENMYRRIDVREKNLAELKEARRRKKKR